MKDESQKKLNALVEYLETILKNINRENTTYKISKKVLFEINEIKKMEKQDVI